MRSRTGLPCRSRATISSRTSSLTALIIPFDWGAICALPFGASGADCGNTNGGTLTKTTTINEKNCRGLDRLCAIEHPGIFIQAYLLLEISVHYKWPRAQPQMIMNPKMEEKFTLRTCNKRATQQTCSVRIRLIAPHYSNFVIGELIVSAG